MKIPFGVVTLFCVASCALGQASKPATNPTTAGNAGKPKCVVIIVQVSGEMIEDFQNGQLQATANRCLDLLEPTQKFNLVLYGEARPEFEKSAILANKKNVQRAKDVIKDNVPRRGHELKTALEQTARYQPDLVWLIASGSYGAPSATNEEWNNDLKAVKKFFATTKTPINVCLGVSFNSDGREFLQEVATGTGGICVDKDGKEVPKAPEASH